MMEDHPPATSQQTPTTSQLTPWLLQPNTDDGTSSGQSVPGVLADMLQNLGSSLRRIQDIPDFDPEQMISWMHSSLGSMNMVCGYETVCYMIFFLLLILCLFNRFYHLKLID